MMLPLFSLVVMVVRSEFLESVIPIEVMDVSEIHNDLPHDV